MDKPLEKLAKEDPVEDKLARLHLFTGLSWRDAAKSLGLARRTADRSWAFARAWLFDALNRTTSDEQA